MRVIPTKDTKQSAQIKRNHRCAGIKCREYVSEDDEYETGGNKGYNPRNSRIRVKGDRRIKGYRRRIKGQLGSRALRFQQVDMGRPRERSLTPPNHP
eukprot:3600062-Pleurochrysis_carterae.AAC.1